MISSIIPFSPDLLKRHFLAGKPNGHANGKDRGRDPELAELLERQPVLIVDDSEEDLTLMRAAFADSGVVSGLRWAKDVREAKAYLEGKPPFDDRARHPLPKLVLLDIQLADHDGFQFLDWLKAQKAEWRRLPVLMLTTSSHPRDIRKAYDLGANSFLTKPTTYAELEKMIAGVVEYWLRRNLQA